MIFPEGYIPLSDLANQACDENRRMHATQAPFEGPETKQARQEWSDWVVSAGDSEGIQSVWNFCDDYMHHPYTMLTNGTPVRISHSLLHNDGITATGAFVSLDYGTLGSGSGVYSLAEFLDDDFQPNTQEIRLCVGKFFGLPVLYKEKDARKFLDRITQWEGSPTALDHHKIASLIVAAYDENRQITKKYAQQHFAPQMKNAEFVATWEIACRDRPGLSKPGPKVSR